jgi:N-acyl-L-homoserine lactone synthetase
VDADRDPTPEWLHTADELVPLLLDAATPIRFDIARNPSELEAVFRLRYRVTVERGWRRPEDMPDGLERDDFDDDRAVQITGWDGSTLAACARVVYPTPDRRLPTETAFGVTAEPAGRVVDAGRLIVAPEYRGQRHRVLGGLAASIWMAMTSRGYRWAAVAISEQMIEFSRALGFDVQPLGPPTLYWGEVRVPALMSAPNPDAWR